MHDETSDMPQALQLSSLHAELSQTMHLPFPMLSTMQKSLPPLPSHFNPTCTFRLCCHCGHLCLCRRDGIGRGDL